MNNVKVAYRNIWSNFSEDDYFFINFLLQKELNVVTTSSSINDADLLIVSEYSDNTYNSFYDEKKEINQNQKQIFIIGENWNSLDINSFDYSIGFDILEHEKYLRFPIWKWHVNYWGIDEYPITERTHHTLINAESIHLERNLEVASRPLAACAFIGNFDSKERLGFIENLRKFMPVDVYGKNTTGWVSSKKEVAKNYQFIVCFENSIYPGYHTEKLPEAYAAEAIPIYFSADTYEVDFNKKCMINRIEFGSDQECIDYILSMTDKDKNAMINEPMIKEKIDISNLVKFAKKWLV